MKELIKSLLHDLKGLDKKTLIVFLYTPIALTWMYYLGNPSFFVDVLEVIGFHDFASWFKTNVIHASESNLYQLCYWVIMLNVFYLLLPCLIIKWWFKESVIQYGFSRLEKGFLKLYLIGLLVMIPLVFMASKTSGFISKYPFLRLYINESYMGSKLLLWECIYFFQFIGLEFFFRGFLVQGLRSKFGMYSIFIMTIPYCMIHFGKPLPESLAAIAAGIVLGWFSYSSRSIWLGVMLHCSVAICMDIMALWQKHLLF